MRGKKERRRRDTIYSTNEEVAKHAVEKIHLVTESFSRKWSGIRGEAGAEPGYQKKGLVDLKRIVVEVHKSWVAENEGRRRRRRRREEKRKEEREECSGWTV